MSTRWKLASRSPAPTSSTNANATWTTTNARRSETSVPATGAASSVLGQDRRHVDIQKVRDRNEAEHDPDDRGDHQRVESDDGVDPDVGRRAADSSRFSAPSRRRETNPTSNPPAADSAVSTTFPPTS